MYNSAHTFKIEEDGKKVRQLAKINPYLPQKGKKAAIAQIESSSGQPNLRKMHTYGSSNTRNIEQSSELAGGSEDIGQNVQQLMDDRSNFI